MTSRPPIDVPLLHIADALAAHAHAHGWTRLGLVGTWWVMDEAFYADRLRAAGLTVELPVHEDKVEIDRIIFEELTQGRVLDGSRATYVEVIRRLQDAGADALASACTELELLVGPRRLAAADPGVAADPRRGRRGLGRSTARCGS